MIFVAEYWDEKKKTESAMQMKHCKSIQHARRKFGRDYPHCKLLRMVEERGKRRELRIAG